MVCIVDYRAGNLTSVKRAFDFLGVPAVITSDGQQIARAQRVVFPGVGHAASAMEVLRRERIDEGLRAAFRRGVPILGICLGTQIVLARSEEGETSCLGLIDGASVRFSLRDQNLKVPHMGWNSLSITRSHPVLKGVLPDDEFYFVHSYYPVPAQEKHVVARCEYGVLFPAVIGSGNLIATQFHPEKSGRAGLRILENFVAWDGMQC